MKVSPNAAGPTGKRLEKGAFSGAERTADQRFVTGGRQQAGCGWHREFRWGWAAKGLTSIVVDILSGMDIE
ncbi:hypothetical protein GCM10010435_00610 [Winogradskya consettensis]|uniref:Uncharacterized protein n=1 Tax=Winogradskya consettensis TaxID=113560 RepID=A0A919VKF0_9ACTN|nr:hypothetical protein Aco04nite_02340 [Actinoplanes consettensis]